MGEPGVPLTRQSLAFSPWQKSRRLRVGAPPSRRPGNPRWASPGCRPTAAGGWLPDLAENSAFFAFKIFFFFKESLTIKFWLHYTTVQKRQIRPPPISFIFGTPARLDAPRTLGWFSGVSVVESRTLEIWLHFRPHLYNSPEKEKSDRLRFPLFLAHQAALMLQGPWGGFRAFLWLKVGHSKFGSIFDHIIQQKRKDKSDRLRFPLFLAH